MIYHINNNWKKIILGILILGEVDLEQEKLPGVKRDLA